MQPQETIIEVEPYTYYKSDKEKRVFLVLWAEPEALWGLPEWVTMIEWGKTREHGKRIPYKIFVHQVQTGLLVKFTPRYYED